MPTPAKLTLAALTIVVTALTAFQHSSYANDPPKRPSLEYRAYVIKDLPIYRQQADGTYVVDTSLIALLAQSSIGDTQGFSAKPHGSDAMVVRATAKAHDKFSSTITLVRQSHQSAKTDVPAPHATDADLKK